MPEMTDAPARTGFVPSTSSQTTFWPVATALFCFALLWFPVINHLKSEWSVNPQYAYGWTVPFVALYLIWKRWSERPAPSRPASQKGPLTIIILFAFVFFSF